MPILLQIFLTLSIIEYSETEQVSKTASISGLRRMGMAARTRLCVTNKKLISIIERNKSAKHDSN
jgi:hypothetical protein